MTPLDQRLYAWLAEADEKRFERAFNAYFTVAFPAVVRHLSRLCRWDPAQLEELAQDALLRFFERVGRGRREASDAVGNALPLIRPLSMGAFHERQVDGWTHDVASFRQEAMGFQPTPDDSIEDSAWKEAIRRIAEQIPGLERQGLHLLDALRLEIRWNGFAVAEPNADPGVELASEFAAAFRRELAVGSAVARAAQGKHPGVGPFVQGTCEVTEALPKLRVPTNGYLFEMAMTIYLDECKKRGRIKRGGTGERSAQAPRPEDELPGDHPLEATYEDGDTNAEGGYVLVAAADPAVQVERVEFFEKFHEYLCQPVEEAADACLRMQSRGHAAAARTRLDSLTRKLDRMLAVLGLMGEGHTQEETAAVLHLTRNQVKYIIEKVQDAYVSFTARHADRPSAASWAGVAGHV